MTSNTKADSVLELKSATELNKLVAPSNNSNNTASHNEQFIFTSGTQEIFPAPGACIVTVVDTCLPTANKVKVLEFNRDLTSDQQKFVKGLVDTYLPFAQTTK